MHDTKELIELWHRAEQVCRDTEEIILDRWLRVESSVALLDTEAALVKQTEVMITRSRALLSSSQLRRSLAAGDR